MPFAQAEYEQDFADSVTAFRDLLAHARETDEVVELDGQREAANDAYAEIGRFVIRHSDLLIAIWDGAPAAGHGGTGQIVAEARALGVPVFHIDPTPPYTGRLLPAEIGYEASAAMTLAGVIRLAVLPEWPARPAAASMRLWSSYNGAKASRSRSIRPPQPSQNQSGRKRNSLT